MKQVAAHSVFYHVCLPGQDETDADYPDDRPFPTLDAIAHDLVDVLDMAQYSFLVIYRVFLHDFA